MKKIIFTFAFALLTFASVNAQEFNVGTNAINLGVGFGGNFSSGFYSSPNASPVFSVSYERGVWEAGPGVISLGGYVGHRTFKYSSNSDNKWSQTVAGVRGAYHYTGFDVENLDVYAGLMLGYYFYADNFSSSYNYGSSLRPSGFIGGRWYFTDAIAGYVEAGFGITNISLGAAFRF